MLATHKLIVHSDGSFSADPVLICTAPDLVDDIWPHVRGYIESTFWRGRHKGDVEAVFADIKSGIALLWIVWDGRGILAAITTKLIKEHDRLVCLITACGGVNLNRWVGVISDIEAHAMAEGCCCVRFEGRKGWKAMFPDYREPWIILEKSLQ